MSDSLAMWVVYDHPTDWPELFVARQWLVHGGGKVECTPNLLQASDLEVIREELGALGYISMMPSPGDDPKIIEVWL